MKLGQRLLLQLCLPALSIIMSSANMAASSVTSGASPGLKDAADMLYHGIYEDKEISLKDGKWAGVAFVKGGASKPSVGLIKNFSFSGDIDGNGTEERVVFLWENSGGSGTRVYMAVLAYREAKPVNLATHLIGDRVQLQMGRVSQGKIELDVIQAENGDAACCPASKVLRTWALNNNQLIENRPQSLGRLSLADLQGIEWTLTQMNWRETRTENTKITLTIDNDKVSGRSGCNRYSGTIKAAEMPGEIAIGQVAGTRMACPANVMEIESRFLKALSNVSKYSFVNGHLALTWKDDDATSTMLFTAQKIKAAVM